MKKSVMKALREARIQQEGLTNGNIMFSDEEAAQKPTFQGWYELLAQEGMTSDEQGRFILFLQSMGRTDPNRIDPSEIKELRAQWEEIDYLQEPLGVD